MKVDFRHWPARTGLLAVSLILLGACTPQERLMRERLDERTGVTYSAGRQALVFARTDSRYSRSARDYVYVGPMESNRQGLREYYLWVGIGTTLDRGYLAPVAAEPEVLYIVVDGELMEFPLRAWQALDSADTDAPLYDTAVAIGASFAARVTRNQLELIAESRPESVRLKARDGGTRVYYRWEGGRDRAVFDSAFRGTEENPMLR